MTDMLLELGQNKLARNIMARAKLPIPLPQRLERAAGGSVERPLEGKSVLVAGAGRARRVLARTLARAGAEPLLQRRGAAPGVRRPGRGLRAPGADRRSTSRRRASACTRSCSTRPRSTTPADLKLLWRTFQPWLPALAPSGRALVARRGRRRARARPRRRRRARRSTASCAAWPRRSAARARPRNLIYVEEGAEERAGAPCCASCSRRASAFVSAQPLRVTRRWRAGTAKIRWTQPLAGKVALVTGAARGIGEATARVLAAEGAHVVCLDRPEDDAALSLVARDVGGSLLLADVTRRRRARAHRRVR